MSALDPPEASRATVHAYHDGTKHHFHRFAQSLGYLDWASQPRPFREFAGAPIFPLYPAPGAGVDGYTPRPATFAEINRQERSPEPITASALGDVLRHALGLSAWKRFQRSRWALRVNPSSGNLHPTEAYVLCDALPGLADAPAVYHYAAERHALELRCRLAADEWHHATGGRSDVVLVALTSIHWREAWKYGERAFRYCQHDLGHAIGAMSFAAALVGWRAELQPAFSHDAIAAVTGVDREQDFVEAEPEDPGCVLALGAGDRFACTPHMASQLARAAAHGQWTGQASQLSEDHVTWSFIDDVARATGDPARSVSPIEPQVVQRPAGHAARAGVLAHLDARALLLQRRSAVAFDGRSTIGRDTFLGMLARVLPGAGPPWNSLWWTPRVHLVLFVHRVDEVSPGLYMLPRDAQALERLRGACRPEFAWEAADDRLPLWRLAVHDARSLAARLSCDQDIAKDGFFSLGMLADFDRSLDAFGPSFYRHLFWETGVVGQTLYLEAEAAGARATGIGCFYDDAVHDVLGLQGHTFQSLYHFTIGRPVDDGRLTTEPGYAWETETGAS
ncbi:MAG TPA: SagB/ThcOx family dehydrogenase [Vicinamibacterales bacterium]|nr:SagB/ThcOx family dehydrogenase [Vicinamibacterales bacterium]